jgi:putative DNA primase/helicase
LHGLRSDAAYCVLGFTVNLTVIILLPPLAVSEYQDETDRLSGFFEDCCSLNPLAKTTTKDLYGAYEMWCEDNGEAPVRKNTFSKMLRERGFSNVRIGSMGSRGWQGLKLGKKMQTGPGEVYDILS